MLELLNTGFFKSHSSSIIARTQPEVLSSTAQPCGQNHSQCIYLLSEIGDSYAWLAVEPLDSADPAQ
jgi:hypothetical protein